MAKAMETLVECPPTRLLRAFVKCFAAMAHGCLRAGDFKRTFSPTLTVDALVVIACKMKKRDEQAPWAAIRTGFTAVDWASRCLEGLALDGLTVADVIIQAGSLAFRRYVPRCAQYMEFANAQRVLCMSPPLSFSVGPASHYTPRSWRHLHPTAVRQLALPDMQMEDIRHWARGSAMPKRCDSVA